LIVGRLSPENRNATVDRLGQLRVGLRAEDRAVAGVGIEEPKLALVEREEAMLFGKLRKLADVERDAAWCFRISTPNRDLAEGDAMIDGREDEILVFKADQID
jgi:hypothetical protein